MTNALEVCLMAEKISDMLDEAAAETVPSFWSSRQQLIKDLLAHFLMLIVRAETAVQAVYLPMHQAYSQELARTVHLPGRTT